MKEIWKPIPGCEGKYEASNLGKIKSVGRQKGNRVEPDLILKPKITRAKYFRVTIWLSTGRFYRFVHRLVAMAFLPNPNNLPVVDHIDKNTLNPRVDNLQWVTISQNNQYAFDRGRPPVKSWLGKSGGNHNKSKKVFCSTLNISFGSTHEAARELGLGQGNIALVCRGGARHTFGFVFRYV